MTFVCNVQGIPVEGEATGEDSLTDEVFHARLSPGGRQRGVIESTN